MEKRIFISGYDRTIQEYLLEAPRAIPAGGILIYLHGATNHLDQGMNEEIFGGAFKFLKSWAKSRNFVYVCPEYRGDSWMNDAAQQDIALLLSLLREEFFAHRIIIVGGSMGGTSALIFAARWPGLLKGVIALCPATDMAVLYRVWENGSGIQPDLARGIKSAYGGDPGDMPEKYRALSSINSVEKLARVPLYLIHGDADALISVEHSRNLIGKLVLHNADFQFEIIPGGDHDSPVAPEHLKKALAWIETRIEPEVK
jgi:dipeptidyl aminopeptidase/acylaminoacyl peptidase